MSADLQHQELFESCINQHADSMYRVAFRLTGDRELASELVQETYLHAWKGLGSLRDKTRMRSWVFGILRNQYTKLLRKLPKATQLAQPETVESSLREQAEPDSIREMVQKAVKQLDEKHKMPILLVSMEGMSVEEAGEILDVPRGTVLSRLHRGRKQLKTIIERMHSKDDLK